MFRLDGKNALITGASGGIGGEIAKALHASGACVALSGTRVEPLQAWPMSWDLAPMFCHATFPMLRP